MSLLRTGTFLLVQILFLDINQAFGQGAMPWPEYDCSNAAVVSYTVKEKESLYLLSVQFNISLSQLMLDNKLSHKVKLRDGQQLIINCPVGTWSQPYGALDYVVNLWNGMTAIPTVMKCPDNEYAVAFYPQLNRDWYNWIGTLTMQCSGGRNYTVDAQPDRPHYDDGVASWGTGIRTVSLTASWAIDSFFGIGSNTGSKEAFSCPAGTTITGFSAGAYPPMYETANISSWIQNLQFLCQAVRVPPSPPKPSRPPPLRSPKLNPPPPTTRSTSRPPPPLPLFPDFDCFNSRAVKYIASASDNFYDLADMFGTSISQLMVDNNLDHRNGLYDGQELVINCPVGTWTTPYGKYDETDLAIWSGMTAAAGVWICPPGEYAVEFSVTSNWIWYAWIGSLTMRCSGGGLYTADAQPQSPYYGVDGVVYRPEGFKDGTVETGTTSSFTAAVLRIFDVGALEDDGNNIQQRSIFKCPADTNITGFSAGAYPPRYDTSSPNSWLMNLQFLCQGPPPPPPPPSPPFPLAPPLMRPPPEAPDDGQDDTPPEIFYSKYFCGNMSEGHSSESVASDAVLAVNFSISSVRSQLSLNGSSIFSLTSFFANDKLEGPLHGWATVDTGATQRLDFSDQGETSPSRVVAVSACCVRAEGAVSSSGNGGVQRILFKSADGSLRSLGNGSRCSGLEGFESVPPGFVFAGFETQTAVAAAGVALEAGDAGIQKLRFVFAPRGFPPVRHRPPPPPFVYNGSIYGDTRARRCRGIHCLSDNLAAAIGILIAVLCGIVFCCGMSMLAIMWIRRKKRRVIQKYHTSSPSGTKDFRSVVYQGSASPHGGGQQQLDPEFAMTIGPAEASPYSRAAEVAAAAHGGANSECASGSRGPLTTSQSPLSRAYPSIHIAALDSSVRIRKSTRPLTVPSAFNVSTPRPRRRDTAQEAPAARPTSPPRRDVGESGALKSGPKSYNYDALSNPKNMSAEVVTAAGARNPSASVQQIAGQPKKRAAEEGISTRPTIPTPASIPLSPTGSIFLQPAPSG